MKLKKFFATLLFIGTIATCNAMSALASESAVIPDTPSISFDLHDRTTHEATLTLADGSTVTIGAEPINNTRALSGTWRIYGYNPLASMEYYIDLEPSGNYTRIANTYGLAISGQLTSFDNETIRVVRATETSSRPAIAEGYARFNYLGNQWVSVWTTTGGVRASIKNDTITTELY